MNSKYNEIKKLIEKDLKIVEKDLINFDCQSDVLQKKLIQILTSPAKRLRPVLAFLYLRACGVEITQNQYDIQCAIELVHNATLVHDDVIDNSDLRRGVRTINNEFDNYLAVISGDYLLSVAFKKIVNIHSFEIIDIFAKTIEDMCNGEIHQYFNKFNIPKFDEYIEKSRQKTAALFEASLESAMIIDSNSRKEKAVEFAKAFGIAFQVRDDLLNFIKEKDLKPTSNDVECGIYTAPIIYAGSVEKATEGIEKTKDLINNYINQSLNLIEDVEENVYKTALVELLELFRL